MTITASVTFRALGSKPSPTVLTLGVEPCILIRPVNGEGSSIIYSVDATGIEQKDAVMVLAALSQVLQQMELKEL